MTPDASSTIELCRALPDGAPGEPGEPGTIVEWLGTRARRFPQRPVFFERASGTSWKWEGASYAAFIACTRRYAAALAALGLCKGDVVAVTLPACLAWEHVDKAVLTLGGAVVGIEPHAPASYQQHIVAITQPRALVVESLEQVRSYPAELLAGMKFAVAMGQHSPACVDGLTVHPWAVLSAHESDELRVASPDADSAAAIVFTSGTSGDAKGVIFSHRQLLGAVRAIVERIDVLTPRDRAICWFPMGNLLQRMLNLYAMERGMEIYFHADPLSIMEGLRRVRPSVFIGVPKIYQAIYQGFRDRIARLPLGIGQRMLASLDAPGSAEASVECSPRSPLGVRIAAAMLRSALGGQMKLMVSGSAPCAEPIVRFFHRLGIPLLEAYGVSENATPVAINAPGEFRIGSVGRPLAPNEVTISEEGEVLVRGPQLCGGYLGRPGGLNLDDEGYYHTGDEGFIDPDGYLWLKGRLSDVVKLASGRRVNLADVERCLRAQDHVEQVIAFAHGRDYVTCALVLTPSGPGVTAPDRPMAAILAAVRGAQADWPRYTHLRGALLMSAPFSMENGEMTPTLKLRRGVIEKHHAQRLVELQELIKARSGADDAIVWLQA